MYSPCWRDIPPREFANYLPDPDPALLTGSPPDVPANNMPSASLPLVAMVQKLMNVEYVFIVCKNEIRCSLSSDNMQRLKDDASCKRTCIPPELMTNTEFDQSDAMFTLENYGGYKKRFSWQFFSYPIFFPAAFRLMLKIFSLVDKFGGLECRHSVINN